MKRHKKFIFGFLHPVIRSLSLSSLISRSGIYYLVPLYHSIAQPDQPHLRYLYHLRDDDIFLRDLEILLKHYVPVDSEELVKYIYGEKEFTKPVVHVTFDDGLSEFYDIAAPVLLKKGIPATCFICPDFIDNGAIMHRHLASLIIDHLHANKGGPETWKIFHEWKAKHGFGDEYYRNVLLSINYRNRKMLGELATLLGISITDFLKKRRPYLDTLQIIELKGKGFNFGAHSMDHPEFSDLGKEEIAFQVSESIKLIREKFKPTGRLFSFPFTDDGIDLSLFEKINADLTFGCAGIKEDAVATNIQRFPVELYSDRIEYALKKEYFYYRLLRTIGKGMIPR